MTRTNLSGERRGGPHKEGDTKKPVIDELPSVTPGPRTSLSSLLRSRRSDSLRRRPQLDCETSVRFDIAPHRVVAVNELSRLAVNGCMACGAKRNQVVLRIVAGVGAKPFVMDLEVLHGAARLTPLAIAMQDLLAQTFV